jgi:hypothetical protein
LKEQLIPVSNLQLNLDNPRYADKKLSEREALISIVTAETVALALHIKSEGSLNPLNRLGVFKHGSHFVPAEGNRRLASIKLLTNPALVDSLKLTEKVKADLRAVDVKTRNALSSVACVVFESEADAAKWVRLTHTGKNGGAGVVGWEREQSLRFDAKFAGKSPIQIQLMDYMRTAFAAEPDVLERLERKTLALSALERIIKDPDMREFLGVKWKDSQLVSNIAAEEIAKPLRKIVKDLSHDDPKRRQNTRTLSRKEDITAYREKFSAGDRPNHKRTTTEWALDPTAPPAFIRASASNKMRSNPSSSSRKYLIPQTTTLTIKPARINDMYRELKSHLVVRDMPNATAVLARVFVEASVNQYLVARCNKVWSEFNGGGYPLSQRMRDCVDQLKSMSLISPPDQKAVNRELGNANSPMHPDSLNAAVHNASSNPKADDLKRSWNNIEPLIVAIWGNLK